VDPLPRPDDDAPVTPSGATSGGSGHLTAEQLDELAARAHADVDPDQDVVRPAADLELERHLAGCAACRSALGDQVEVGALLRREPDPGPMPADVLARLDAALAGAAATRTAAHGSERHNVVPLATHRPGTLGRIAESRVTKALVAAAAVVLIGAGSFAALHRNGSGGPSSSSVSASSGGSGQAAAPNLAFGDVPVRASGTAYTSANIRTEVNRQLAAASAAGGGAVKAPQDEHGTSTLTTAAGLRACLTAIQAGTARPLLVDLATYNGKPAAVIVLSDGSSGPTSKQLWVVAPTCSPGKDGTMFFANVG
jgi:hypothetical protein